MAPHARSQAEDGERMRLAEVVGALSLATDLAFGQPLEQGFRTCLLAMRLGEALALPAEARADLYYVALLRYLGCTGHAHEVAEVFGDEIAARARSPWRDLGSPRAALVELARHAGDGRPPLQRLRSFGTALAGGRGAVEAQFRGGCETAQLLAERLGMTAGVRDALWHSFERYDGKGFPAGLHGDAIALPMRIVQVAQDAEVLQRVEGTEAAAATIEARSGAWYDPRVVACLEAEAVALFGYLEQAAAWDEVLALEPVPRRTFTGNDLDEVLLVLADFVDLKSPYTGGHSRGVADLAARAAERCGLPPPEVATLRRAGLLHDLGRTSVPNSIWDKPAALTPSEWESVRLHPYFTGRILARLASLVGLAELAEGHHERLDGSGYHRGLRGASMPLPARILAAADAYHAMTEPRAYREARDPTIAAAELRALADAGRLDSEAVRAVLAAAGHRVPRRAEYPAGLSQREVEVLRLLARGMTTKQIGGRLVISERTAAHHVQHIYAKIGVSTRAAAALFAIQNDLVADRDQ